ncbi:hypothetical protein Cgig2_018835 [Carnegiea gigantea]|uniref:Uncharacterized protein n=1 Tax=Carnegiea gigantea TaxID=171969 RepID=A0A9Q1KIL8_9CARY|nr:hypothetical protein Cgig2_018835 [Carnegiea gigantea]
MELIYLDLRWAQLWLFLELQYITKSPKKAMIHRDLCMKEERVEYREAQSEEMLALQFPQQSINGVSHFSILGKPIRRIMEGISVGSEVGGAGGAYSYNALKRLDQLWTNMCSAQTVVEEPPQVVTSIRGYFQHTEAAKKLETFDVLVCGGTLGIFIATALITKGLKVGVIERNVIKGVYYNVLGE